MRAFFGTTLLFIGLVAVLLFGLPRVYSYTSEAWIAMFLVFGGGIAALSGAGLSGSNNHGGLSRWLYAFCFIAFVITIIFGLINVFNEERTGVSIYLLVVGFFGACISAIRATQNGY